MSETLQHKKWENVQKQKHKRKGKWNVTSRTCPEELNLVNEREIHTILPKLDIMEDKKTEIKCVCHRENCNEQLVLNLRSLE